MPAERRDLEWDVVMPYVAVEAAWWWGWGTARQALHGPKWVIPAATFLNSSSIVCRSAHSSSVTYLHPDRRVLSFLGSGEGNRGFFVVLCKVVDDLVWSESFARPGEAFHHRGGQCFDISRSEGVTLERSVTRLG